MNKRLCGIVAVLFAALASCTSVDDNTGAGLIPGDQYFTLAIDSSFVINTYNIIADSTRADDNSIAFVGSYVDDRVGSVSTSLVFQMGTPFFGSESSNSYGNDVIIDSLAMVFNVEGGVGKMDVPQTFEVYKLWDDIYPDSVYHTDFDPSTVIESEPYFTFDYTYDRNQTYMIHKIYDPELIRQLSDTTAFFDNEKFHERFKGFYIKPRSTGRDAAVYTINLTNSYLIAYYLHNNGEAMVTRSTLFLFSNTASYFTSKNQNIQVVDYDYSQADPALNINDMINTPATTFVQGYGGLTTVMKFSPASVEAIKNRVAAAGYSHVAVNKALLQIPIIRRSNGEMNTAPERLGMYTDYFSQIPIADYDYQTELSYGYTIPYGGHLNGSKYMYEMDITRYIQALFNGSSSAEKIILAPDVEEMYTFGYTELATPASADPMRLVLTYSMVK